MTNEKVAVKPTKMFQVIGPLEVGTDKSARRIEKSHAKAFWETHPKAHDVQRRIGCYVFAIRAAKGVRPVYVGRTWKSFAQEAFGLHQRDYYNAELANIVKGTPVMFFVIYPSGKGKPNRRMIRDLEEFLIQVAVTKNSNLRNVQNRKEKKWGIQGVIRSGKGKTSKTSTDFKKALSIHTA